MGVKDRILREIESNKGIFDMKPAWVHRTFLPPGRRLKLHPYDYFDGGGKYGGVCERWMASTGMADNGPLTRENEGLSFIAMRDGSFVPLRDAINEAGDVILGADIMKKYGCLRSFCKLYDYKAPIHFHVHLTEDHAQLVGVHSKPEAYFFPVQLNSITYDMDYTYFGFNPGATKEDVVKCLENWGAFGGDNGLTELSRAYKLKIGTSWNIPSGILHAPGSLVTYEPQRVSDTSAFFQTMVSGYGVEKELLTKFYPYDKKNDMRYIVDSLDWEANMDPNFKANHYNEPIEAGPRAETLKEGYAEDWIVYGAEDFSAKELTVMPGKTVSIKDNAAYGLIMMDGYGSINGSVIETPAIIRYHGKTSDEKYVTVGAAQRGVTITNASADIPLVMLKHFGPDNPDAAKFVKR